MSQTTHRDIEAGSDPEITITGGGDIHRDHPQSIQNQPLQGESNFGDSSGPLFSIYSKAAEEEDDKMVDRWQKDADGILIFTGLFSAAVAALLAVTVQDLRPNSQDTSAFYLGNIYEVLADPNTTRASTSVAKPAPFSPPTYAIWVNSLWFLSLVISLTCALLATSQHQWSRRYIRVAQLARCSPEKRARMRAFFADGVDKMHIPWAVEGLPTLLHLSLFLFFGGLVIFLFNIDHTVFSSVIWWIGLFSMVYGLITVMPILRHDSPYHAPLSRPAWFFYAGMNYLLSKILLKFRRNNTVESWGRFSILKNRYQGWMLGGVEKAAEETVSERSSEIDIRIFDWTMSALGEDDSLEKFFEAAPGFFSSKLVKHLERDFPEDILDRFWISLDRFMNRTLSSNSVTESVKSRRVTICRDIMSMIPCSNIYMHDNLRDLFDQAPVSIERLQAMARWFTHMSPRVSYTARARVGKNLPKIQKRDDRWIALVIDAYGLSLSEGDLQHNVSLGGDNVLLAILIDVSRRASQAINFRESELVAALTKFDICHTLPGLQHDFCTLWNEIVQEARNRDRFSTPSHLLRWLRHLYAALHEGTDAAPTAFSTSTDSLDTILFDLSSYPLCDIAGHLSGSTVHLHTINSRAVSISTQPAFSPDTSPYLPSLGGTAVPQQTEQAIIIVGPPLPSNPTTTSIIRGTPHAPIATPLTNPVYSCPPPTYTSPTGGVATVLQDIPPVAMLSHRPEETTLQRIVAPCVELDMNEILPTASMLAPTRALAPVPAPTPPVLNKSLTYYDTGLASTYNPLLPTSSGIGFSIPAFPPPFPDTPLLNPGLLALLSTTPSRPSGNGTLQRLRARRLVNTGSMCFVNAILQLLVHSPPFWNLFKELGDLKGRSGARGPETGDGATPLVDAMVKFFEEFTIEEKGPLPQPAAGGKEREDEEAKKVHNSVDSFEPTYVYDAMKEKKQLKHLLDGQQQDAGEFFRHYLDVLDEELLALLASISGNKSGTGAPRVEEPEVSQSSLTDVRKRVFTAESVESPLMCIFCGTFRSIVRAPNQPDTVTVEYWRSLQLDIQHGSVYAIEDALARISHLQPVQLGPSGFNVASQQVQIKALPPVLALHLKRFLYDATTDSIVKISKPVKFAPELEIPPEIMAPVEEKSAEPAHYKLYGVLYHHGESAGSGQYTVDVLHPNGDSSEGEAWLHIDDEAVSAVRHEDVFGGHDNERVDDQCVYMLFYCRTAPTRT